MKKYFAALLPKTKALLESARNDVFPDYAVGISYRSENLFTSAGCGVHSLFDLASLTKVLCTTTIVALGEQSGRLSVEQSVKDFFPSFPDARVKLSHLLEHSSGLPAWLALHSQFHLENGRGSFDPRKTPVTARMRYEQEIIDCYTVSQAASRFEKQATYSDLGFMLLGWAVEKALGAPIDALFQEMFTIPFKLESLQFLPITPDVVPTEKCPWRGRVLRGEVHDDNCYVLGGIAGHAGVFGHAPDVVKVAEMWLDAYHGKSGAFLKQSVAEKFWRKSSVEGSVRSLGWDGVDKQSSSGQYFSPLSRGHLGYTGTSLWIDPERNLIVTLLTNRVHPTRTNEKIKIFRPLFHDTLLTELAR